MKVGVWTDGEGHRFTEETTSATIVCQTGHDRVWEIEVEFRDWNGLPRITLVRTRDYADPEDWQV